MSEASTFGPPPKHSAYYGPNGTASTPSRANTGSPVGGSGGLGAPVPAPRPRLTPEEWQRKRRQQNRRQAHIAETLQACGQTTCHHHHPDVLSLQERVPGLRRLLERIPVFPLDQHHHHHLEPELQGHRQSYRLDKMSTQMRTLRRRRLLMERRRSPPLPTLHL